MLFLFFITYKAVINRAMKYTENNVVKIPTPKVIEKPFIGPEPKKNRMNAEISVVIFASITAVLERL